MKESEHESYLGEVIGLSVSDSFSLTIKKRTGLAKKSILEIKSIVENWRSQTFGGIQVGLMLWESCVIPSLVSNEEK